MQKAVNCVRVRGRSQLARTGERSVCDGDGGSAQQVFIHAIHGRNGDFGAHALEAEYADQNGRYRLRAA